MFFKIWTNSHGVQEQLDFSRQNHSMKIIGQCLIHLGHLLEPGEGVASKIPVFRHLKPHPEETVGDLHSTFSPRPRPRLSDSYLQQASARSHRSLAIVALVSVGTGWCRTSDPRWLLLPILVRPRRPDMYTYMVPGLLFHKPTKVLNVPLFQVSSRSKPSTPSSQSLIRSMVLNRIEYVSWLL